MQPNRLLNVFRTFAATAAIARTAGVIGVLAVALAAPVVSGAETFTTNTRAPDVDFDFDGPLLTTGGDLGDDETAVTLPAADLPASFTAAGMTSLTLTVTAGGGNVSADYGGTAPRGLGVASAADLSQPDPWHEEFLSNLADGESLTFSISAQGVSGVKISGVRFG